MAKPIGVWLEELTERLGAGHSSFEAFVFEGTLRELTPALSAWNKPHDVTVTTVDVADIADRTSTLGDAREAVERELARVASTAGQAVVALSGLYVMPALYPAGFLQPVFASLRGGGRIVVFVVPPAPALPLPPTAVLTDWRALARAAVGAGGPERIIDSGGTTP